MNTAGPTKEQAIEALNELHSIICDIGIAFDELRAKADASPGENETVCRMLGLAIRKRLDDALDIFDGIDEGEKKAA